MVNSLKVIPVWFDSLGSKSASVYVKTKDVKVLIDPGSAALQPGFPLPDSVKYYYHLRALGSINRFGKLADVIIITHYHYDHHTPPSFSYFDASKIYGNKLILVKDPNAYINKSQHERARFFMEEMVKFFLNKELDDFLIEPKQKDFEDPIEWIPEAMSTDFGSYNERRREVLERGRKWFENMKKIWSSSKWVKEINEGSLRIRFADGKEFRFGNTKIRFTKPMFHGIEYDRLGWVIGVVIEDGEEKFLYSSDIQGPFIEDYATWIIDEKPDYLILDGPQTYQLGYMLNVTNFKRALKNVMRILIETDFKWMIYDHHLLRDIRWEDRIKNVREKARELGKIFLTAAELKGYKPVASVIKEIKNKGLSDELISMLRIPKSYYQEVIKYFKKR